VCGVYIMSLCFVRVCVFDVFLSCVLCVCVMIFCYVYCVFECVWCV